MSDAPPLFLSDDLVVRRGPLFGSAACFVTFAPYTHERTLERAAFGDVFLASRRLDAIHVISRTNAWFDYPEMDDALAAIAAVVGEYERVLTYGSSMGGYAAVRFAERLGAAVAIAISPQYGVDRVTAPFERRFVVDRAAGGGRLTPWHGSPRVTPYVFFDPLDLDARHAAQILRSYPLGQPIALPHAGHPAAPYLAETGLLTGAIVDLAEGRFDPKAFALAARRERRRSSQYLFTLARRLGPHHQAAKVALVQMAIAARDDAAYRLYLATLLELAGDIAAAEVQLKLADGLLPDYPVIRYAQASFLMRRGRAHEAREILAALVRQSPENHRFTQILAVANALTGSPPPAVPAQIASRPGARLAWSTWLRLIGRLARLHQRGRPWAALAPRWHAHYFNLPRELALIDEWRSRRAQRHGQGLLRFRVHKSH